MSYLLAARDPEDLGAAEVSPATDAFDCLVGASPPMLEALELARHLATRSGPNVLIIGETGTGKETLARAIHHASPRGHAPFIAVDCASIPVRWLEGELFGKERGGKQGLLELAADGTLFLDHVTRLPLDVQPKLLRALEERRVRRAGGFEEVEVRCRVIAASDAPLETLVREGALREDLFHRLSLVRVTLPPLRERDQDVLLLASRFLEELEETHGVPMPQVTDDAAAALCAHAWPGNVRELRNVIERAAVVSHRDAIDAAALALAVGPSQVALQFCERREIVVPPGGRSLESAEAELVRLTLEMTGGNKSAAARILGISRPTLDRKIATQGVVVVQTAATA
ncbi:MAG: sigma 54-interacting transcriptional regulator [Gemmatimonadota bacterium]